MTIPSTQELENFIKDYCPYIQLQTPKPETIGKINTWPKTYSSYDMFFAPKIDKNVWFKEDGGAYKFILEVAGFGKEHLAIEIKSGALIIKAEKLVGENVGHYFTERYFIPENSNLDLENASVEIEYGVLTIFFPAKKVSPQTIKLL
jgi:HSP20 family molecular chaperone IbpA